MEQFKAIAARSAGISVAFWNTGRLPGTDRSKGATCLFGGALMDVDATILLSQREATFSPRFTLTREELASSVQLGMNFNPNSELPVLQARVDILLFGLPP